MSSPLFIKKKTPESQLPTSTSCSSTSGAVPGLESPWLPTLAHRIRLSQCPATLKAGCWHPASKSSKFLHLLHCPICPTPPQPAASTSLGSSPSCCRKRVGVTGTMTRQRHRRTWVHLFLQKAPNHNYWKTIDKKTLGPTKNDILCPKTKKKPQRDGRRGAMMIKSNPVHQFSSVTQSCSTHGNPMNCSMPGLPVHHKLPEFIQI